MPYPTPDGELKLACYVGIIRDKKILLVDYKDPPNPKRRGWWVPAPELAFGTDPTEFAEKVVEDFKLHPMQVRFLSVESFVIGQSWHILFHHRAHVRGQVPPLPWINKAGWFGRHELPHPDAFAHGSWERRLAEALLLNA